MDYFDTSQYGDSVGWDYYSAQDVSPDDVYYSEPANSSVMDGFFSGFSKLGDAVGGIIGKTGGYFDQWVDYQMQDSVFGPDWRPDWAAPEPEDNQQPVIINSGMDKQTLLLAGGVAVAFVLILALKK